EVAPGANLHPRARQPASPRCHKEPTHPCRRRPVLPPRLGWTRSENRSQWLDRFSLMGRSFCAPGDRRIVFQRDATASADFSAGRFQCFVIIVRLAGSILTTVVVPYALFAATPIAASDDNANVS